MLSVISYMQHRRSFFRFLLLVALFAFAADVMDLRDEMFVSPGAGLDDNITSGMYTPISDAFGAAEQPISWFPSQQIWTPAFFNYHLHFDLRAPPAQS